MATGYMVLYITPGGNVLNTPDNWNMDYVSDAFTARTKYDDRFEDFDHEPTKAEKAAVMGVDEFEAEGRWWGENLWRLRVRYPIQYTTENRGGVVRLYALDDPKIPASWGHRVVFWGVLTTAAKHLQLHTHIATTLGFAPVGGAWAALDPDDQTQFLPNAVQIALGLTNQQQLTRVTALRNGLQSLGYTPTALSAILAAPAGKTEDDLVRALVHDLGFTMADLRNAAIGLS